MNTIELINRFADVWAGYMAHGIIETAFLLGFVSVIYVLFKKKISSHFAYWLFLFVLIKLLCPVEIRVPQWMTYLSAKQSITSAVGWAAQPLHLPAEINPEKTRYITEQTIPLVDLSSQSVISPEQNIPSRTITEEKVSLKIHPSRNAILMGLWSIITLLFLSGFALNQWRTQRWILQNTQTQINNPLYEELIHLSGMEKSIPLFPSHELTSPVAVGLIKPRLFIPENFFKDLTSKQASWILLHELMHVRRYDLWIATLQRLIQIVFFFNPAVWIANWVVNQFREYACDDAALAICNASRRDCGEGLLSVLENIKQIPSPVSASLGLLQPYSIIRKRLERILDTRRMVQPRLSLAAVIVLILIGVTVLPYVRAKETPVTNSKISETKSSPTQSDKAQNNSFTHSYIVDSATETVSNKEIEVKLPRPVTIKGRVVTKNETPVQSVTVSIQSDPETKITKTNTAGEYEFNGLGTKNISVSIHSDETNQYFTERGKYFFDFVSFEGREGTNVNYGFKEGETRTLPDFVIDHIEPSAIFQLQIMDMKKNPIANAKIEVENQTINETYVPTPPVSRPYYSDKIGIVIIKDYSSSSQVAIKVEADGFILSDKFDLRRRVKDNDKVIPIRLERESSISGLVVEKDTLKPVENALVFLTNARNGIDSGYNAITNAQGMYEIHGLIPLPYQIHTVAKEFVTSTTNTFNVPSETNLSGVNFALDKGHSIQGIIRNVTGEPIEKAELSFLSKNKIIQYNSHRLPQDASPGSITFPESTSASDGSFHVSGIPSNGDILIAQANGYAPQMMPLSQDIIKRGQLTITMKSDSKIYGTVCDESGNPIDHCELHAADTTRNMFTYKTFSDKDGNFLFRNLPSGAIKISMENPYRMFKTVFLKNGDTPFVSLGNTGKQVSIEGTLFDKENHPLPHYLLTLTDNYFYGGGAFITVATDDQGKYKFRDISEGDYYIIATNSKDYPMRRNTIVPAQRPVRIESGKTVPMDIHLNASVVSLQFFNQQTNAGIEGVHIRQTDENNRIETVGGASNKDGVLTFANNTTGSFHFITMHPGYYTKPFQVEVSTIIEDSTIEVAIAMKPTTAKLIAHVDSPDIEQLNRNSGSFRAIQGSNQFFLTSKVIDISKRLLEITGFPEGEMLVYLQPFMVRDSRNMPMSFPKSFKPVERETATLDFPLVNVERTCFHFIMPDSENLPRGIQMDIPDIENSMKIAPDYISQDNNVYHFIPRGKHLVRILVPGYKPIECTPSEMPRNVLDQIEINLANYK